MDRLEWIPVICKAAAQQNMNRKYVKNRIGKLRQALSAMLDEWGRYEQATLNQHGFNFRGVQMLQRAAALIQCEFKCMKCAIDDLEVWSDSGRPFNLQRAGRAYAKAQKVWQKRLTLLCQLKSNQI